VKLIFPTLLLFLATAVRAATEIAPAAQPQLAINAQGVVWVAFGRGQEIHVARSDDGGATFAASVHVASLPSLMLGRRRGPRIVAHGENLTVTAMAGDLHAFRSADGGRTWSAPRRLPEDILGPIKNKPVQLANGDILAPVSTETPERQSKWAVHFERTRDLGLTWERIGPVNDGEAIRAIQPSILFLGADRLLAIGRSRQNRIFEVESADGGTTWKPMTLGTLPNPNSGTDAVTLRDGRHLIVYNHVPGEPGKWGGKRTPLNVAVSRDGHTWQAGVVLEKDPGEYSYPAIIQAKDGLVHITYTWKRERVKHVVLDPSRLAPRDYVGGAWPE